MSCGCRLTDQTWQFSTQISQLGAVKQRDSMRRAAIGCIPMSTLCQPFVPKRVMRAERAAPEVAPNRFPSQKWWPATWSALHLKEGLFCNVALAATFQFRPGGDDTKGARRGTTLSQFRSLWIETQKRRTLINHLVGQQYSPEVVRQLEGMMECDQFDVLAYYGVSRQGDEAAGAGNGVPLC